MTEMWKSVHCKVLVFLAGPLLCCCGTTPTVGVTLMCYCVLLSSSSPSAMLILLFRWRSTVPFIRYCTHTLKGHVEWISFFFLLGARVPKDPEENGCDPVQVIQDRLCVSWLAYSWLLALDGSCWSKRRVSKPWVRVTSFKRGKSPSWRFWWCKTFYSNPQTCSCMQHHTVSILL